jgi:hypothetical protein
VPRESVDIEILDEEGSDVYFYDLEEELTEEILRDIPGYLDVKKIWEDWNEIAP